MNDKIINFIEYFNIFMNKKGRLLNNGNWLFQDQPFTHQNIKSHLVGIATYQYYLKYTSDLIGFDIDLHEKYFNEDFKMIKRLNLYHYITDILGPPSLIFQSSDSKGLHLYYKIDIRLPFEILKNGILKKMKTTTKQLKVKSIEILPTPTKALRLPYAIKNGGALLNEDLKYICEPTSENAEKVVDYILKANVYSYYDLFNSPPEISNIWVKQVTKKKQLDNYRQVNRFDKYMKQIEPEIFNGNTNGAIEKLCFNCYTNNFTEEQALYKIQNIFDEKNIVIDSDTKEKRLKQRISSHYVRLRKQKKTAAKTYKKPNRDLFQDVMIDNIIDEILKRKIKTKFTKSFYDPKLTRYKTRKIKTLKNFLNRLYGWTEYIKNISEYERQIMNYQYNFFYYYTRRGFTPLPKTLLENWNDRYNEIIEVLKEINLIEVKQKFYNPFEAKKYVPETQGICNYYEVNFYKYL